MFLKTRRITPLFLAVFCMLTFGTERAYAQQMANIDSAIQNAATSLSDGIKQGSRIAVLAMHADSVTMSNYVINEMIAAFVNMQRFTVVDRAQLDLLMAEMEFQMSGYVDDHTAQSLGRILGVGFIITGAFEPFVANYRLTARVIEVQTAAIRGVFSSNVQNDATVAFLMGGAVAAPQRGPRPPRENLQNELRFNTVGISAVSLGSNDFIPSGGVLRATFSPANNFFLEGGVELSFWGAWNELDGSESARHRYRENFAVHPYINAGVFLPFSGRGGWYAAAGVGFRFVEYEILPESSSITLFAMNFTTGFNFWNWLDVSYTLRTNFRSVESRFTVGYVYRFMRR